MPEFERQEIFCGLGRRCSSAGLCARERSVALRRVMWFSWQRQIHGRARRCPVARALAGWRWYESMMRRIGLELAPSLRSDGKLSIHWGIFRSQQMKPPHAPNDLAPSATTWNARHAIASSSC